MVMPVSGKRKGFLQATSEAWGDDALQIASASRLAVQGRQAASALPGGAPLDRKAVNKEKAVQAAAKLVPALPLYVMAKLLNVSEARMEATPNIVADVISSLSNSYSSDCIDKARNVLVDASVRRPCRIGRGRGERRSALHAFYRLFLARRACASHCEEG
jgi:hypothetical protein